ncbi:MAG: MDR family oxidoreductase [Rhizomicrobium sp.]
MTNRFKALLITKDGESQTVQDARLAPEELMEGDVTIAVSHSTVNYKDGLALTGRSPVVRRFPMIPGIDLAGTVEISESSVFQRGDKVLVNGFGLGETHFGGYAEKARVKSSWLVGVPEPFSCAEAMAVGTAGYTAMLAILALEDAGVTPQKGPVLVTGAAGGVGSMAVSLLSALGFHVMASTGRPQEQSYLAGLGAAEVFERSELAGPVRPLARERWAGAVDSAGSRTLANVIAATQRGGAVAACGLAQGPDLPASVVPFILRGISLLGVDSTYMNMARRHQAWERLAHDLDKGKLAAMTHTIGLDDVSAAAQDILAGRIRGRLVVRIAS